MASLFRVENLNMNYERRVQGLIPGSVETAGRPLHRFVLAGVVSGLVAFVAQSELQRVVQVERAAPLQQAQLGLSHLGREQAARLRQQLVGGDVDEQLVRTDPTVQQDPPDEVWGIWPRIQGSTVRGGFGGAAARVAAVSFRWIKMDKFSQRCIRERRCCCLHVYGLKRTPACAGSRAFQPALRGNGLSGTAAVHPLLLMFVMQPFSKEENTTNL